MPHTENSVGCCASVTSDFCVNTLLAHSVGPKKVNMSNDILKPYDIVVNNNKLINEDQLKEEDKAQLEAHMEEFRKLCLSSFERTKSGVIKDSPTRASTHHFYIRSWKVAGDGGCSCA